MASCLVNRPYPILYRLLRDDENPKRDGIMAKWPSRDEDPAHHIQKCAIGYMPCQWISTCATEDGRDKMIDIMNKWRMKSKSQDVLSRVVVINGFKLRDYQLKCGSSLKDDDDLLEVVDNSIIRIVPEREKTGRILDFKDYETSLLLGKYTNNAWKCEEVLIERFIPAHCCIVVEQINADWKDVLVDESNTHTIRFLYRLLRDDENPLKDGIMAKYPSRNKEPVYHIRQCSQEYKSCQWISACASFKGLKQMFHSKQRNDDNVSLRWVKIDRWNLEDYANKCEESLKSKNDLVEVVDGSIVRNVPDREMTGRILDFTDPEVMGHYLPKSSEEDKKNNRPRNCASAWEEVLIERFIPPHCCDQIGIGDSDELYGHVNDLDDARLNNKMNSKTFVLKNKFMKMVQTRERAEDRLTSGIEHCDSFDTFPNALGDALLNVNDKINDKSFVLKSQIKR